MALALSDQYNLSVDAGFNGRVRAAVFSAAVTMFNATPNNDPTKQGYRMALVNAVIKGGPDVNMYVSTFAWTCVSRSSLTTVDDLTDAFLNTTCGTVGIFDAIAQECFS
jgi:hypothetical protein